MREAFTEREALREYLEFLREERRKLGEQYWGALDRLRYLDENEVVNAPNKSLAEHKDKLEHFNKVKNEVRTPALEMIREMQGKSPLVEEVEGSTNNKAIPTKEIELAKENDERKASNSQRVYRRQKVATEIISEFLKDEGIPIKLSRIDEHLKEKGYDVNNPTTLMNNAMKFDSKIERASFGHYQYRF